MMVTKKAILEIQIPPLAPVSKAGEAYMASMGKVP